MSPKNPQDPQKGKPHEDVQAAQDAKDAAEAKAAEAAETAAEQPEPTASEGGTPSAEGTAAETTGVDKAPADALADAGDEEPLAASGDDDPADADEDVEAVDPAETEDQQERADAEAARAAAAAEEAAEAADEAQTETAEGAAAEAEELAEKAEEAADAAAKAPKRSRSRKAREAEQAADQAEEAAEEAKKSASRVRSRRGGKKAKEEPKRKGRKEVPVGLKVSAQAKYVRTSARKARLVCDHIRDKDVVEARAILAFTTRDAAKAWSKLLESAVANAEHNHELVGEELRIFNVHADEGPTLKRYRPRAMGRATRIRKRTSHLSITLTPKEL
jgi:ribosomal protein L22